MLNNRRCSMAMSAKVKICSPSTVMVTSPLSKKILEWDKNPKTNKKNLQTIRNVFQSTEREATGNIGQSYVLATLLQY